MTGSWAREQRQAGTERQPGLPLAQDRGLREEAQTHPEASSRDGVRRGARVVADLEHQAAEQPDARCADTELPDRTGYEGVAEPATSETDQRWPPSSS